MFVKTAECGGFARAAQSLGLANATVAAAVRNLERHLEVPLIVRAARGLELTTEGRAYLPGAREILAGVAQAEAEVRGQLGKLRGRLHVEATISLGHALVCPLLPEFSRRYPDIVLALTLSNQPNNVFENAIDVALRVGYVEDADLVARPVCETPYVVCCAPALRAALPAHPAQLDSRACLGILLEQRSAVIGWRLARGDEVVEIRPDGPLHLNSGAELLQAVRSGMGVACVLDILAQPYLAEGSLVRLYPDWTTPAKSLYLVAPKSRTGSAKVRAFTDFLLDAVAARRRPPVARTAAIRTSRKKH
ncbi:LysR family transcriptional regulator [Xylophilus sp. GOD-11R]|uniref:LysR family transcriptional regulator n=1 Tax=Xylophilus sp. GOD-11R TaxID=3089814 RepID=UPI00298BE8BC|nr:LysR substrate-binding domain-containing protein [Xylophilus sp. GOD-11R]WPB55924.1 LysR substrate-binding domain-containing protein [Xylophilus sp. GOD-11R]